MECPEKTLEVSLTESETQPTVNLYGVEVGGVHHGRFLRW